MQAITLGRLIRELETRDPRRVIPHGFRNAHAAWHDEAFLGVEPANDVTVGEMLGVVRTADGAMFPGRTTAVRFQTTQTPVWLARRAEDGQPLTDELLSRMIAA